MGSLRARKFSFSRFKTFQKCKRSFFFEYYFKDEIEEHQLRDLKRVKNLDMECGTAVHDAIRMILVGYINKRAIMTSAKQAAKQNFFERCHLGKKSALLMREGKNPFKQGSIAHAILYNCYDGKQYKDCNRKIEQCIDNFFNSEHWAFIQQTNPKLWEFPIDPQPSLMPTFRLSADDLSHVEIYYSFDFAFEHDGITHVIDWKLGESRDSDLQLAIYALGLANRKRKPIRLADIRVHCVNLQNPGPWNPQPIDPFKLASVKEMIEDHIRLEEEMSVWDRDAENVLASVANREDFPPAPTLWKCAGCKFALVCKEGRAIVEENRQQWEVPLAKVESADSRIPVIA